MVRATARTGEEPRGILKVGQTRPDDWLHAWGTEKGTVLEEHPRLLCWVPGWARREKAGRCGRAGRGQGEQAGLKRGFRAASGPPHVPTSGDDGAAGSTAREVEPWVSRRWLQVQDRHNPSGGRSGSRIELWGTTLTSGQRERKQLRRMRSERDRRNTRWGSLKAQGRGDNRREGDWP